MAVWHYVAAPFVLALLGFFWHLWRSIPLPLPDRLTSSWKTDAFLLPGGYRWTDFVYETEFDEDGYYRWDSWKNLRVCIGLAMFYGTLVLGCLPQMREGFAYGLDSCAEWLWNRLMQRLENPW